jgi:hypothetical protein
MGLEDVEFLMDVEDEFGIRVPDEAAQCVTTVGEFFDVVLPLVRDNGAAELGDRTDREEYLWARIKTLAAKNGYDVRAEEITRSTRFVEDLGYG